MTRFCFCLTTGVDGYLPDDRQYVDAACAVDAFDAICEAIRDFSAFEQNDMTRDEWATFFEHGCKAPDASMWNFTVAHSGNTGVSLSVIGMTAEEYERESAGE